MDMNANTSGLPPTGVVLGIDVGWNQTKPTTCLSLIEWTHHKIYHSSCLAGADEADRRLKLGQFVGRRKLLAVGIDGPLVSGLRIFHKYRTAEALLSRGKFQQRGKPGPTNGGNGRTLHQEATILAKLTLSVCDVKSALYSYAIYKKAIGEAFPNAFLSVLQADRCFPSTSEAHRRWTDLLFPYTKQTIRRLLFLLLPNYELDFDFEDINGHEQIASFVCALTALCVAANRCVAVGDTKFGYIVLPPLQLWGDSIQKGHRWAEDELRNNAEDIPNSMFFSDNRAWTP
jgi:predicted RNase H-like nuclease